MITCREFVDLLCDYLSGDLAPARRADVERHLRECPPCVAYAETYRITIHLARRLPCPPPPPEVLERLRGAVAARLKQGPGAAPPV
jgi:anti-sigma factor RsiW